MTQPELTLQSNISPYSALSALDFIQTTPDGSTLPVLNGNSSNFLYFRIYNNYALNTGVANAHNIQITTHDGVGSASHSASTSPVSQLWLHVMENGFGQNSLTPGAYTVFYGQDTPIGVSSVYVPEWGSDGNFGSDVITAGSNNNGVGFIEIKSYVSLPQGVIAQEYNFAMTVNYTWST